jgi:glycosyltransferase involved in cell wall biosynthesis
LNSLISIIIPYYNKKDTILRSVNSVLSQTYTNWELVLIDDCGEDRIQEYTLPQDDRIRVIFNESNKGAAQTRQRGLNLSNGKYVAFLDADDWWDNRFLEYCIQALETTPKSDGAYVKTKVYHADGTESIRKYSDKEFYKIRETLIRYARPWQTGGILWRKSSCGSWGQLQTNEDSWFEISSAKHNCLIPIDLVGYFVDQSGDSHLSTNFSNCNVATDVQELFLRIFLEERTKLNLGIRITLFTRLLRGQLKILV